MPKRQYNPKSFFVAVLVVVCGLANAHTNEYLDTIDGEHGGQLRMSGAYHFELVTRPGSLTVYVTDHGFQPIETADATSEAMVVTDGKKATLKLQAAGKNVLEGRGKFTLIENSIIHLKVIMNGGEAELVTFEPLRKRDEKSMGSGQQDHH